MHTKERRSAAINRQVVQSAPHHLVEENLFQKESVIVHTTMPPKRPCTLTGNLSPPPEQRATTDNEHHHSPLAGHHPDLPADAAVATASPQLKRSKVNEMLILTSINSTPGISPDDETAQNAKATVQPPIATSDHFINQPSSTAETTVLVPNTTAHGGARAAFIAAQQQRTVTCNLSLLPLSKYTSAFSPELCIHSKLPQMASKRYD